MTSPWLRKRGFVISTLVFALASFVAWYSWTQVFVPNFFPESAYQPPWSSMAIALIAIATLSALALGRPCRRDRKRVDAVAAVALDCRAARVPARLKFVRFQRDNCFCALRLTSIERRSY